jgi:hypothetical protein
MYRCHVSQSIVFQLRSGDAVGTVVVEEPYHSFRVGPS